MILSVKKMMSGLQAEAPAPPTSASRAVIAGKIDYRSTTLRFSGGSKLTAERLAKVLEKVTDMFGNPLSAVADQIEINEDANTARFPSRQHAEAVYRARADTPFIVDWVHAAQQDVPQSTVVHAAEVRGMPERDDADNDG